MSTFPNLDKIRFAVGTDAGPRSSWWFVQIEEKGDVYMSVNTLAGDMKLSLHGPNVKEELNRYCQFGFTKSRISKAKSAGLTVPQQHYFFRWQRPLTPERDARHVMSLYIPTDFLNKNPPAVNSAKQKFLYEPPPSGYALEFALFYPMEPADALEEEFLKVCRPMIYSEVKTGETIHFVDRVVPFDKREFLAGDWGKGQPFPLSPKHTVLKPGSSIEGLTMIVANEPELEGFIKLWEISNIRISSKETAP